MFNGGRISRNRFIASAAGTLIIVMLTGGCILLPSSPAVLTTVDAPDPALASVGTNLAEVYTTDANGYQIPEYRWNVSTNATSSESNALAGSALPWWASGTAQWAPSVRKIDGEYIMIFSASRAGKANCLAAATSTNGTSFIVDQDFGMCYPSGNAVGYLDPYLFLDVSGQIWLYYSEQWSPNGGSEIDAQEMSSNGLATIGTPYDILDYSDLESLDPSNQGTDAFIENPAFVNDPYNAYDLVVSFGSWQQAGNYESIEVPCFDVNGSCDVSYGADIQDSGDGPTNPGGVSFLNDNSPAGNYAIWMTGTGPRPDRGGPSAAYDDNPGSEAQIAQAEAAALPIRTAQPVPPIACPYHWPLRSATEPSAVIGAPDPPSCSSSGS
jgi:hypothetical protein